MDAPITVRYLVAVAAAGLRAGRRTPGAEGCRVAGRRLGPGFGRGTPAIITQFVVCGSGMLIGQDVRRRVLTARSPRVARRGGLTPVHLGLASSAPARVVVPLPSRPSRAGVLRHGDGRPAGSGAAGAERAEARP